MTDPLHELSQVRQVLGCSEAEDPVSVARKLVVQNAKLTTAVSLLNSMVLSGEDHSDTSREVVQQALHGGGG